MKKSIVVVLLTLNFTAFGQYAPFKKYDFSKGGYTIAGLSLESDYNQLAAKLGEFYTNDIVTLNKFKNEWVFYKKSPQFSCGYHYGVLLCKNGKVLESFNINLNCDVIATDRGYFYFDPKKLSDVKTKLLKPVVKKISFKTVDQARGYLEKTKFDKGLIMMPYAESEKYDGEFTFEVKLNSRFKDNKSSRNNFIKNLRKQISEAYPNELFALEDVGGGTGEMYVEIACRTTLKNKFKLYPLGFGPWSPYALVLTTYSFQKSTASKK